MSIRLFVDAHVFDNGFEGSRTFIKGIYSEMLNYDDVELFMAARNIGNLKKAFPSENITFIKYKTSGSFFRLVCEIPMIIRKYKIDYAHFQYVSPWIHNCKFIVTLHDLLYKDYSNEFPWHYRMMRNYFFKRSAVKADILTTVSEYSKDSIQKHFGIKGEKISIIKNGINRSFLQKKEKEVSRALIERKYGLARYLLYVSRIEPRKNHAFLLKAFFDLQLHKQNFTLVLIGKQSVKTKEFDELYSSISHRAKKSLLVLSRVDDEELFHFYNGAELFLYPSKAEGFGIPPLEAAVLKTPVLCSGATAMKDFSFFTSQFEPSDYDCFKSKLQNLLDEKRREDHLESVSNSIKENYCWKKSAQQLFRLIKSGNL
jgi:glycosyltransferase involved in cell wall biosynthesis